MMAPDLATAPADCRAVLVGSGAISAFDFDEHMRHGAQAYGIESRGALVGAFLLRVERVEHGRELVIVAAGGDEVGILSAGFARLDEWARRAGCCSVRFHTMRPALVRLAQAAGFGAAEYVMRKGVK